ncbi:type IV pilin [Haloarchaeobius sp. HRN-SO-5]|uniref:type IV pilin n=1 Tax=Haloarchaeobius sp. HRN-SO-5 TaxID=3446118 RepID=UPI003EC11CB2
MDLKNLFTDEDAVSPVIGVILMVAITVILAAVIGAFVLNIGDSTEPVPQAQFSVDFGADGSGNNQITLKHEGGGPVNGETLSVLVGSTTVWDGDGASKTPTGISTTTDNWDGAEVTAGDQLVLIDSAGGTGTTFATDTELDIVWSSSSSDNSQVLYTSYTAF